MEQALTERLMSQVGKHMTIIRKPLKPEDANFSATALAKSVYKTLFDFIVGRVNKSLPFKGVAGKSSGVVLSTTQGTEENEDCMHEKKKTFFFLQKFLNVKYHQLSTLVFSISPVSSTLTTTRTSSSASTFVTRSSRASSTRKSSSR